jgi:hypothetical protein
MAIHWKIPFVSLRSGTTYTVNIYDPNFSGSAVVLKGGTEPFTTDEDGSDDQFTPVRTQSGYFRIVDDGKDASGNAFNWKQMLPSTDTDRPVTLTDGGGNVCWAGFMQSQTFSGVLYGNPQEREFPVICPLSILAGEDVDFNRGLKNFAFLLKEVCDVIDVQSGGSRNSQDTVTTNGAVHIDNVYVQGGADAKSWLNIKVDWQNFAESDGEGVLRAKYSLFEALEDMCRFWGWTARICGTTLYLTCSDDSVEQTYLTLTRTQLNTKSGQNNNTTTGGSYSPQTVTLSDSSANPIFASTGQTDYKIQGPHRAVVKADCNEHDTVVKFAPKDIEDAMGDSYSWVQGDGDLVGYFTTTPMTPRDGVGNKTLKVSTPNNPSVPTGAIAKRQIYQSKESDNAVVGDMLLVYAGHVGRQETSASIQLQTLRPMSFSGGSISLGGTAWMGTEPLQQSDNLYSVSMRLGIGMTRASAKWWYMTREIYNFSPSAQIERGWDNSPSVFNVPLQGNTLKSTGVMLAFFSSGLSMSIYPAIPVPSDTYGYIFIDIMGAHDYTNGNEIESFEIANLEISYSRETIDIPTSTSVVRPRELKTERVTTKEYSAVNTNDSKEEWNANCIFASDNNMEYGYGLLLDGSGNIVSTVGYGGTQQHPEQHLANRVVNYWATAKRRIDTELLGHMSQSVSGGGSVTIGSIQPRHLVTLDSTTFIPIAISRNWRDDIVKLSLLQQ